MASFIATLMSITFSRLCVTVSAYLDTVRTTSLVAQTELDIVYHWHAIAINARPTQAKIMDIISVSAILAEIHSIGSCRRTSKAGMTIKQAVISIYGGVSRYNRHLP